MTLRAIVIGLLAAPCLLLLMALLSTWGPIRSRINAARTAEEEKHSVEVLEQATSPEALDEAVGHLGVVFRLPDRSWIAIRYNDSHAGGIWSCAVALDSEGNWFHSSHHFCGTLQAYRQLKAKPEEAWLLDNPCYARFQAIEKSANLDAARDELRSMGFADFQPPGK